MDNLENAVILAGGLGTRLKSISKDTPKPLMPIKDKVFLDYPISQISKFNIENIYLAISYNSKFIINHYKDKNLKYLIEEIPLGTGGAIKNALNNINSENILFLNGDTLFNINIKEMYQKHLINDADITIASKILDNPHRYGTMDISNNRVVRFNEKKEIDSGVINCGIYIINKRIINKFPESEKFSFENEILENKTDELKLIPYISDDYFIDIGIPEDYYKAVNDLPNLFQIEL